MPSEILLVEDNRGDVVLLQEAFAEVDTHPQLTVASNGSEAMDLLRSRAAANPSALPGLIVLDLNLPRKDGKQVLEELKADPVLARIPVVILTSSNADRHVAQVHGLPDDSYVLKPTGFEGYLDVARGLARRLPPAG